MDMSHQLGEPPHPRVKSMLSVETLHYFSCIHYLVSMPSGVHNIQYVFLLQHVDSLFLPTFLIYEILFEHEKVQLD